MDPSTAVPPARGWLRIMLSTFAVAGGLSSLLCGLVLLSVRLTPDTGHGEDVAPVIVFALVLPVLAVSALLAIGSGIGGVGLSTGRGRAVPSIGLGLTGVGIAMAIIPIQS